MAGSVIVGDIPYEDQYNFTWHGKRQASYAAQVQSLGSLRPCKEESVDWEKTQNLFLVVMMKLMVINWGEISLVAAMILLIVHQKLLGDVRLQAMTNL